MNNKFQVRNQKQPKNCLNNKKQNSKNSENKCKNFKDKQELTFRRNILIKD